MCVCVCEREREREREREKEKKERKKEEKKKSLIERSYPANSCLETTTWTACCVNIRIGGGSAGIVA